MNTSPNRVPWWMPNTEAIIALFFAAGIAIAEIAKVVEVQSKEYGVLVFAAGAAYLVHWLLNRLKSSQYRLSTSPISRLINSWSGVLVLIFFLIPIVASGLENGSLAASLNPAGYWKDELARAKTDDCNVFRQAVAESAEELQVVQRKRTLGIATNAEVISAAQKLKAVRDFHETCKDSAKQRIERAEVRLSILFAGK